MEPRSGRDGRSRQGGGYDRRLLVLAWLEDVARIVLGTLSVLLGAWALWLLLTEDPDGGRHPVGGIMLAVAVLLALLAAALLKRRSVRHRDRS
jgi:heme A synthase